MALPLKQMFDRSSDQQTGFKYVTTQLFSASCLTSGVTAGHSTSSMFSSSTKC
jgi:hypothetical protein